MAIMASLINIPRTFLKSNHLISSQSQTLRKTLFNSQVVLYDQNRHAGHAKWQNIKSTKMANDLTKCRTIGRYVQAVRRAIVMNKMIADPKLNSALASVLSEAQKFNVPKATLERAIVRATNLKILNTIIEIEGPSKTSIIVKGETDNPGLLRRDIKKICKKYDAALLPDDTIKGMFHSRGFIRVSLKTKDNRDVNEEFAEEAAILTNCEEVQLEKIENGEEVIECWLFSTDGDSMNVCRGELEKLGLEVTSSDLELVPYRWIEFPLETYEKLVELTKALREHDQVTEVYHNASEPSEES